MFRQFETQALEKLISDKVEMGSAHIGVWFGKTSDKM